MLIRKKPFQLLHSVRFIGTFVRSFSFNLHRSINCDHFVVIVWIVENVIDILLSSGAGDNRCPSSPIGGDIPVNGTKHVAWRMKWKRNGKKTRLTYKIHYASSSDRWAAALYRIPIFQWFGRLCCCARNCSWNSKRLVATKWRRRMRPCFVRNNSCKWSPPGTVKIDVPPFAMTADSNCQRIDCDGCTHATKWPSHVSRHW